jgi:hypothetical protein
LRETSHEQQQPLKLDESLHLKALLNALKRASIEEMEQERLKQDDGPRS